MTPTQFQAYLKSGSGRAILGLRAEADKEQFADIFLKYIKAPHYISDKYDADVLDCFPRRDAMAADFFAHFEPLIKQGETPWILSFLALIGYKEVIEDIVNTRYHQCLKALLEALSDGKMLSECPESTAYFHAAAQFARIMDPAEAQCRRVLVDMADLFRKADTLFISPIHIMVYRLGDNRLRDLLKEIFREHPFGPNLLKEVNQYMQPEEVTPDPKITAADILSACEDDFGDLRLYLSFLEASPEVIRQVAGAILKETDHQKRAHMISFFNERVCRNDRYTPPAFPLDPDELIKLAESERALMPKTTDEDIPAAHVMYLLCTIHHPAVRAYGEALLSDPDSTPFLRQAGMRMTFGANYKPEDGEKLLSCIRKYTEKGGEWNNIQELIEDGGAWDAVNILMENGERGIPDLPLEALIDVAEEAYYFRHRIVRLLDQADLLTPDQKEALALDRHPETRAMFQ